MVHVSVPKHAPPQPEKAESELGMAERVTFVPMSKVWSQSSPQFMPLGLELIVPEPMPFLATLSWNSMGANVAVTLWSRPICTVQVGASPEHPPPCQLINLALTPGVAVRVREVSFKKRCSQVWPQSMPVGSEVAVPSASLT